MRRMAVCWFYHKVWCPAYRIIQMGNLGSHQFLDAGQLLKHYSPDLDVYRVTGTGARSLEDGDIGDGAEGKLTVMAR